MDLTPNKRKASTANNVSSFFIFKKLHNSAAYLDENTSLFMVKLAVCSVANRYACAPQV